MENTNYKDSFRNKYVLLIDKEIEDEKISRQIERSIFNYTINVSEKKKYKKEMDESNI